VAAGQTEQLLSLIGRSLEELTKRLDELEAAIQPALEASSEAPATPVAVREAPPATSVLADRLLSLLRMTERATETVCSMTRRSTL
jgi:hypothetical protein